MCNLQLPARVLYTSLTPGNMVVDWITGSLYVVGRNKSLPMIAALNQTSGQMVKLITTQTIDPFSIVLDPVSTVGNIEIGNRKMFLQKIDLSMFCFEQEFSLDSGDRHLQICEILYQNGKFPVTFRIFLVSKVPEELLENLLKSMPNSLRSTKSKSKPSFYILDLLTLSNLHAVEPCPRGERGRGGRGRCQRRSRLVLPPPLSSQGPATTEWWVGERACSPFII